MKIAIRNWWDNLFSNKKREDKDEGKGKEGWGGEKVTIISKLNLPLPDFIEIIEWIRLSWSINLLITM